MIDQLNTPEERELPFVSVIIPAYNESKHLGLCLESIKNLNYPSGRLEVIVVDNGSTDPTVEIARRFTERVHILQNVTVAALRNYGVRQARGAVNAFIDADCVPDADWLRNAVQPVLKEGCITGSRYLVPPDATWIEKAWFSQRPRGRMNVTYINSGNLIVSAKTFAIIGGFDESLATGEDYEFCSRGRRLGVEIISDDSVKVTHLGNPKTLRRFIEREIWHGLGGFGSLGSDRLDKVLIGTLSFTLLTLLQLAGLFRLLAATSASLLIYSSAGILILLLSTVVWRKRYISTLTQCLQLFLLYYFFYLGRSVSFGYSLTGKPFRRKK